LPHAFIRRGSGLSLMLENKSWLEVVCYLVTKHILKADMNWTLFEITVYVKLTCLIWSTNKIPLWNICSEVHLERLFAICKSSTHTYTLLRQRAIYSRTVLTQIILITGATFFLLYLLYCWIVPVCCIIC